MTHARQARPLSARLRTRAYGESIPSMTVLSYDVRVREKLAKLLPSARSLACGAAWQLVHARMSFVNSTLRGLAVLFYFIRCHSFTAYPMFSPYALGHLRALKWPRHTRARGANVACVPRLRLRQSFLSSLLVHAIRRKHMVPAMHTCKTHVVGARDGLCVFLT